MIRDPDEEGRSSTPLELLFDLCFVVAVAQAATALHISLLDGQVVEGLRGFAQVFFAIWWAWMSFTWFASAHDSDDLGHRLLTLVQMAGALVLASGVLRAADGSSFAVVTVGYAIMRLGLVAGWLRVGRGHPEVRGRSLRYAAGIAALQVLWFARLLLPGEVAGWAFVVLAAAELGLPVWAERAGERPIFHAEHIGERFGLFTIIVLGESILSATTGFDSATKDGITLELVAVGAGALVVAFSAWWLYFDNPGHQSPDIAVAFRWGYGHVILFASLAAFGAGVYVAAENVAGHGGEARTAALAVAGSVAGYLLGLTAVLLVTGVSARDIRVGSKLVAAVAVAAIGAVAPVGAAVIGCALVMVGLAALVVATGAPTTVHEPVAEVHGATFGHGEAPDDDDARPAVGDAATRPSSGEGPSGPPLASAP